MIPKIIHYCWFGKKPLNAFAKKCINSWKKYCPDYEIIEWNETNFDISCNEYVKEAYQQKKWAFVSDVARLYALTTVGGIYLDTDVRLIKSLDELLEYEGVLGFETPNSIGTAFMACKKNNHFFRDFLENYESEKFVLSNGTYNLRTNVDRLTEICRKKGIYLNNKIQMVGQITIFPNYYFSPKDNESKQICLKEETYAIHYFGDSWHTKEERYSKKMAYKLKKYMPERLAGYLGKMIGLLRFKGIRGCIRYIKQWIDIKLSR